MRKSDDVMGVKARVFFALFMVAWLAQYFVGCATNQELDRMKSVERARAAIRQSIQGVGDGEVAKLVKTETVANRLEQAGLGEYAKALRTGQVGLTALRGWLIERGVIKPTAADTADLLDGYKYGTSYQIVFEDGRREDVPPDAQVVATDTPIAPKLPAPRIRILTVKEIAPKINDATKPDPLDGLVPSATNAPASDVDEDVEDPADIVRDIIKGK